MTNGYSMAYMYIFIQLLVPLNAGHILQGSAANTISDILLYTFTLRFIIVFVQ